MSEDMYEVLVCGVVVARGLAMSYALLLIQAVLQENYNDDTLIVSVRREGCKE